MPEKFNFPRPQLESLVKYFLSQVRPDMWRWIRSQPLIFCEGGSNFWVLPDPILWQYVMA